MTRDRLGSMMDAPPPLAVTRQAWEQQPRVLPPEPLHGFAALIEAVTPEWRSRAACRGMGPTLFFVEEKGGAYLEARRICAGCEVRAECADAGLSEHFGCWGGKSPSDRGIRGLGSTKWVERPCAVCATAVLVHPSRKRVRCASCAESRAAS